ncbi:hypothetical protein V5O48_018752, partial [Marasmius crinis-equi]
MPRKKTRQRPSNPAPHTHERDEECFPPRDLPLEIVSLILRGPQSWDTLHSFSLVSPVWERAAQERMFKCIWIHNTK